MRLASKLASIWTEFPHIPPSAQPSYLPGKFTHQLTSFFPLAAAITSSSAKTSALVNIPFCSRTLMMASNCVRFPTNPLGFCNRKRANHNTKAFKTFREILLNAELQAWMVLAFLLLYIYLSN